ncbi:MAG: hypothetical protein D6828_01890, partial [Nitrospirae bacterium]
MPGDKQRAELCDWLILSTGLLHAIPDKYRDYRKVVHDGVRFLLMNISKERFAKLLAEQLTLSNVSMHKRLITLAKEFPTLHKLGQIVARNRNIDPQFRRWLITLEHDTTKNIIPPEIIKHINLPPHIKIGNNIIAEASVGVVVPFYTKEGEGIKGVLKILKPNIVDILNEEMAILDRLGVYFHENREKYPLKDFRFIETFKDIKEGLLSEIDLLGEQQHLRTAKIFYDEMDYIKIPEVYDFSTKDMTAMEFIDGNRITESELSTEEKKWVAEKLFASIIGLPLFSTLDKTIFHGDPHGGNVFITKEGGEIKIALLDWSLTGRLTKEQRANILRLSLSI